MGTWAVRFAAFINKDVVNPNESKKTAVMTRWLCTVMMLYVTMTFGIEECGREQSMEDALEAADRKLYMGKARGRNQVVM